MEDKLISISVRQATPEDAEAMLQIQRDCIEKTFSTFYPQSILKMWSSLLNINSYIAKTQTTGWTFVAVTHEESNEQVVGYGYLNTNAEHPPLIPKQYKCDLQVESLYISVDHHRQGIGKTLMEEMESKAAKEGCTRIGVLAAMPAVSFYDRVGYLVTEKRWYNFKPDKPEDEFTDKECPHGIESRVMVKYMVQE